MNENKVGTYIVRYIFTVRIVKLYGDWRDGFSCLRLSFQTTVLIKLISLTNIQYTLIDILRKYNRELNF